LVSGCSDEGECPTCPEGGAGAANLTMEVIHPDPAPALYQGVWAAGPNDVFVSATGGVVLRYKDSRWMRYNTGTAQGLRGIWGSSADNVIAVGEQGEIVQFDGSSWSPMYSGVLHGLSAVWGAGPDTVYAVGDYGTFLKYIAGENSWSRAAPAPLPDESSTYFHDVWGNSANDVWIAGETWAGSLPGIVWHYQGTFMMGRYLRSPMTSIWAASPDTVMAGDRDGYIWHHNGVDWVDRPASVGYEIRSIWGAAPNDVWAGNVVYSDLSTGQLTRFDGNVWSEFSGVNLEYGAAGISGVDANEVYAIGRGAMLAGWDGSEWETLNDERITAEELLAIWGISSNDFWTFGAHGQIYHCDGAGWSDTTVAGVSERINDAWGSGPGDVYAVGSMGTLLHFDGNSWSEVNHGLDPASLESIWGTASDDIWVGGHLGQLMYHGNLAGWELRDTWPPEYGPARSLWGSAPDDYYAVVYNGVMHYNGSMWSVVPLRGQVVTAVHGASDTEVYFLVGGGGLGPATSSKESGPKKAGRIPTGSALLRYDGTNLVELARDIPAELSRIYALGSNNVFMSGYRYGRPAIAHYNGAGVSVNTADMQSGCYDLWCTGSNTAYATGTLGAVFHATAR
jgi:hypothetical protein